MLVLKKKKCILGMIHSLGTLLRDSELMYTIVENTRS
jgi:hypothetical protein